MAKRPSDQLNQSAFARAIGISGPAAHRIVKRNPILRTFSLDQAIQWYQVNILPKKIAERPDDQIVRDAMAGLSPVQKATVLVKTKQAAKLDRQIKLLDEFYVARDVVRSDMRGLIAQLRAVLLAGPKADTDLLASMGLISDEAQTEIEDVLYAQEETRLNEFARQVLDMAEKPTNRKT